MSTYTVDKIEYSGNTYNIQDNVSKVELTQAQYDLLTPAEKSNGNVYFVYDGTPTPGPTPVSNLQNLVDGSSTASVRGVGTTTESSSYTMGLYSFAEGYNTKASGHQSHAEGYATTASGWHSHAEGYSTTSSGTMSHAEGDLSVASGANSHAQNLYTTAQRAAQTAIGKYNIPDTGGTDETSFGDYALIIGNGTASDARSNALTVDWSGNVNIPTGANYKINGSNLGASDVGAQATLISGTNIKTINNQSLLGSGNISIQSEPEIFIATYGVTAYADVAAAYNAGKTIYCKRTQTLSDTTVDSLFPLIGMTNTIISGDNFIVYSFGTSGNGETVRITVSELPPYWHLEETHEMQIIRWTEVVGE